MKLAHNIGRWGTFKTYFDFETSPPELREKSKKVLKKGHFLDFFEKKKRFFGLFSGSKGDLGTKLTG